MIKTANELADFLSTAKPGDSAVYHIGNLGRARNVQCKDFPEHERREIGQLAGFAWRAYEDGLVHLMQRRVEPNVCEYIVVMRPTPGRKSGA